MAFYKTVPLNFKLEKDDKHNIVNKETEKIGKVACKYIIT